MKVTKIFTMKSMKDLKKKLHELHGNLSCFVVPVRAWELLEIKKEKGRYFIAAFLYK